MTDDEVAKGEDHFLRRWIAAFSRKITPFEAPNRRSFDTLDPSLQIIHVRLQVLTRHRPPLKMQGGS
jgi:hypothetical protein